MPCLIVPVVLLAGFFIYIYWFAPPLPAETDAIIDAVLKNELPEVIRGKTGYAWSGGIQIWYECISPEGTPKGSVLLNIAMGGNALLWDPKFVRAFVEHGYQVIRYDYRGTGMSDWMQNWNRKQPYSLGDMAQDAVAVLDALAIKQAHMVGFSMGGMIAQEIAIYHPDRVQSLTLIMTSGYVVDPDLPGLTSRYLLTKLATGLPLLRYRLSGGEKNLIKEPIAKMISTGSDMGLDIKETAELVLYDLRKRRGINLRALFQHQAAVSITPSRYEKLKRLDVPTLVIHGTADAFIPVAHGRKLAELIPGAKALWVEGAGHVFPLPDRDVWMKAILLHVANS